MAVYTHVDDDALADFLACYNLPPATTFKGIAEGVENSNFFVETADRRFILTLYEKRVDAADLPFFLALMRHVVRAGLPAAAPVSDENGDYLQQLAGRPAALISFLDGTSPAEPSADKAYKAGVALAQLHNATGDFVRTRPNALGPRMWTLMAHRLSPRLDHLGTGTGKEIIERAAFVRSQWPSDLPTGIIHADLFPDNVLFLDGQVSGLIDFYFACTDLLAYDLAISMNAWTPEGSADPTCALALRRGYESIRPLTPKEADALPLLLEGAALRFFLTRAHDALHQIPGSLVRIKDPRPYLMLMRQHREAPTRFAEMAG